MEPDDLARDRGVSGKTLRAWLRETYPRSPAEHGSRWSLSAAQVESARRQFVGRRTVPTDRMRTVRGVVDGEGEGDIPTRGTVIASKLAAGPPERCRNAAIAAGSGFYAWWVLDDVVKTFRPEVPLAHPAEAPGGWSLLYVGISPNAKGGASTVASRIGSHLDGRVERSTFRYSIASLMPSLGLLVRGTTPNGRKPRLATEVALTDWITANCWLTTARDPAPWARGLEERVIHLLRPPLNGEHSLHPFHSAVSAARSTLLRSAQSQRN